MKHNPSFAELRRHLTTSLSDMYGDREAQSLAGILIEHVFGLSLAEQISRAHETVDMTKISHTDYCLSQLLHGKPIQHIIGLQEFHGRKFYVNSDVLIPRPETEELTSLIISNCRSEQGKLKILDIGTGSGCIAVSLALELENTQVHAVDVSDLALMVARRNAKVLGAHVQFQLLDVLSAETASFEGGPFDIVVSNPPYVLPSEASGMLKNVVEYEPHIALFTPVDEPTAFYSTIAVHAASGLLQPQGTLYFEINPILSGEIRAALINCGFNEILLIKDMFGKERFVKAGRSVL